MCLFILQHIISTGQLRSVSLFKTHFRTVDMCVQKWVPPLVKKGIRFSFFFLGIANIKYQNLVAEGNFNIEMYIL